MGLFVQYGEVRSEVIAKLEDQKERMVSILGKLDDTVMTLPSYMEGDTLNAYMNEYETIVKSIYEKLNVNLGEFVERLEVICKEWEKEDKEMHDILSKN